MKAGNFTLQVTSWVWQFPQLRLHFFAPNAAAALEEEDDLWFPDGFGWYAGEPVPTPSSTLTTQEQPALLESHPLFTGACPECGWEYDRSNLPDIHWDCPECGWLID